MSFLKDLTGETQKLVSGELFHVKLPTSLYGGGKTEVTSVSGLVNKIKDLVGDGLQIGRTVKCGIDLFTKNFPTGALNILQDMANGALTIAADMAMKIATIFEQQINRILSITLGTVMNVVNAIFSLLNAFDALYAAIVNLVETITELVSFNENFWLDDEECKIMFCAIAACYLNKLFGDKLQKLEDKITNAITSAGDKIATSLAKELEDVNVVSNYINQESFMVQKAALQINNLSNSLL